MSLLYSSLEPKTKATSERADVISQFVERINAQRIQALYKPLGANVVAIKLSHLSLPELYYFLSLCKQARSFSQCFWGNLKVKK